MKTIGLIGGMSPESTIKYYEHCFRGVAQSKGECETGTIVIYSLSLKSTCVPLQKQDWQQCLIPIKQAHDHLEKAGVDFFALCCNI